MSNLVKHAEFELRRAGLFDKDSDYDGMLGQAVLDLVKTFSQEGHSGYSAHLTLDIFNKVARFKTLTPITSNPDEWMQVSPDMMPDGSPTVRQNTRQSSCFSNDGGKTYYDIDAGDERAIKTSDRHDS
jgi:hypothetical protein